MPEPEVVQQEPTKYYDAGQQPVPRREFDASLAAHLREHDIHEKAHLVEHKMTEDALTKADHSLERRLEGMNEFRSQLERQAGAFLTRDTFEKYTKEQQEKSDLALANANDKYDTIVKAIVNRHDSDMDAAHSEILDLKESLRAEIQGEREHRKTFEGSINTWKWIATFLGASGVAGVIYMFASGAPHP